jgi:UMF1 family MFS transporter
MKHNKSGILPLISWASFDFAETIFSANILSVFFPLWIVNSLNGEPIHYSISYSSSLIISIIVAIFVGKYADKFGRRKNLFNLSVVICSLCLLLLSKTKTLYQALVVFFLVNLFYQQSLVLYNSLLTSVSNKDNRSLSSGIGVGIGYIGGAAGLYIISKISSSEATAFIIVAIGFFAFSMPIYLSVSERPFRAISGVSVKKILINKPFLFFILSCLFLTEAAHTIIIFMSIYLDRVYGMSRQEIVTVIATSAIVAAIGSPFIGKLSDRLGVSRVFSMLFPAWAFAFCIFPFLPKIFIYAAGITFGLLLASVWTTIRPMLIELSPKEEVATRFAFLSISERMAAVIGPLWWGLTVKALDYKTATLSLALFPLTGWLIYMLHRKTLRK